MTRFGVWLAWVAANVVPSVAVSALLLALRDTLGVDRAAVTAYVVLFGLVATVQALVWARWHAARSTPAVVSWRRWAGWTIVALIAAMFFGVGTVATLDGLGHEHLGLIVGWAVAGLVLGAVQAAILGASGMPQLWWVLATVASWAGAAAAYGRVAAAAAEIGRTTVVRWLVGGLSLEGNIELGITAATFAVYGMLTALVLARLTPGRLVPPR